MKWTAIFIYSIVSLFSLYFIKFLFNNTLNLLSINGEKYIRNKLRNLQVNNTNLTADIFINNDTYIESLYFNNSCSSLKPFVDITFQDVDKETALNRFKTMFQQDTLFSNLIKTTFINNNNTQNESLTTIIIQVLGMLAPLFVLVIVTSIGWMTCCSCCCYDYCPIICRRKDRNAPYSSTDRLIPIIMVMFTGFSLIIPSILSFVYFKSLTTQLSKLYCDMIVANYAIKQ